MTIYLWTLCFVLFSKAQHRTRGPSHPSFLIILTRLKGGILFLSPILSPPLENKFALSRFSGGNELMLKRNYIADHFRRLILLLHLLSQRGDVFLERAFCRKNQLHLQQVNQTSTHSHGHPLLSENPSDPTGILCNDPSSLCSIWLLACLLILDHAEIQEQEERQWTHLFGPRQQNQPMELVVQTQTFILHAVQCLTGESGAIIQELKILPHSSSPHPTPYSPISSVFYFVCVGGEHSCCKHTHPCRQMALV